MVLCDNPLRTPIPFDYRATTNHRQGGHQGTNLKKIVNAHTV